MSVSRIEAKSRRSLVPPRLRAMLTMDVGVALSLAFVAAVAGYTAAGHRLIAAGVAGLSLAVAALTRPAWACVALGVAIPFFQNVAGGTFGLNVAVSDLLLVLITAGILAEGAVSRDLPALRALRPVLIPVMVYVGVMVVLLAAHAGLHELIKTGQRIELFALPLLAGAYAYLRGRATELLVGYALACTFLSVVWPVNGLGMQKNPTGQFIANAILLLVAVRRLRRWTILVPVLLFGLFWTQSRGAILGALVGVTAILLMQGARSPQVLALRVIPLALLILVGFRYLPSNVQERTTTLKAGTATAAQYSILIRDQYKIDAHKIIDTHPWTGIGVGNYRAGNYAQGTITTDPHEVLLLQAAEGGYELEAAFVVLLLGVGLALARRLRKTEFAAVAAGVMAATVAHGLVDVYWVRGTPLLGWLLVGMTCGCVADQRRRARDAR